MGFATAYDVWVAPIKREGPLFAFAVLMWFTVHYFFICQLPKRIKLWSKFTNAQREDIIIRCCSVINGAIMSVFAIIFLNALRNNQWHFSSDYYAKLPYYRYGRVSIVAYFVWDMWVCFYYKWSAAWKVHAFASFIGSYILAYPFSENYAVYYTGCFEVSNMFFHIASISRTLATVNTEVGATDKADTYNTIATYSEYMFALLFTIVRVICGTFVFTHWLSGIIDMLQLKQHVPNVQSLLHLWRHKGNDETWHREFDSNRVHSEFAVFVSFCMICIIQCLQYVWFVQLIQKIIDTINPQYDKEKCESKIITSN